MRSLIVLILFFLNTSIFADTCDDRIALLLWLEEADANLDAKQALKSGDTKLMAVYGFALTIPGVTEEESAKAYKSKNYKAIEGTGDDLCSERHGELVIKANDYAVAYNKILTKKP